MRRVRALLLAACLAAAACSFGGFFQQYEYEEELYLSLDGSATVYVNTSVAALNALRGTSFDTGRSAALDRGAIRAFFTTAGTRVASNPTTSTRRGRRFVHVRVEVDDVRRLGAAAPFAWSSYEFHQDGDQLVFRQTLGASAQTARPRHDATHAPSSDQNGWTGDELVAFRLHVPSDIVYHNAGPANPRRGNILVWEQRLNDRLRGASPVTGADTALEARMKSESILSRTLWLFGAALLAVALMFAVVLWWILRRGPTIQRPA